MLYIKNGTIIDPVLHRMYQGDLQVIDGKIIKIVAHTEDQEERIAESAEGTEKFQVIDAKGLLIGPGLIDTHVHFRDPGFTYKEDILSGGETAKKGGYTGIVLMANTKPSVDNTETLN